MLDFDLAEIYGYTTKAFNQQVKRNLAKFDEDFKFQLSMEETLKLSRSQFVTSIQTSGVKGGRSHPPYAFTEQGIYMLMTVLKGDLAIRQSKALIRMFKQMKDCFFYQTAMLDYSKIEQIMINKNDIKEIKSMMATKDDLVKVMKGFLELDTEREYLFLNGQIAEAREVYASIYAKAKSSIIIIDNYINLKTLLGLKNIQEKVSATIISDNNGGYLSGEDIKSFQREYPNIKITFKKTNGKIHDRFIILDYKTEKQTIYHCGGSIKDGGTKTTAIIKVYDNGLYTQFIDSLLN